MARSVLATLNRIAREQDRAQRQRLRDQLRVAKEQERELRRLEKERIAEAKEQQRQYLESRIEEAEDQNIAITESFEKLSGLLVAGLRNSPRIDFEQMLVKPTLPRLELGKLASPLPPPRKSDFTAPSPAWIIGWIPWVQESHRQRISHWEKLYADAVETHRREEDARLADAERKQQAHEKKTRAILADADRANLEVEKLREGFESGNPDAVADIFELVLSNSEYPEGFPQTSRAQYLPESRQLVVEYDLPTLDDVIPTVKAVKYVKTSDSFAESPVPESQRRSLYTSVVAQSTLRGLFELFSADESGKVDSLVFNGYVNAIDRGTGRPVRPCVVTVRTTKDIFLSLDLKNVEATACLRTLNASVSKTPAELAPVRPILELNMADPRFVEETDVLSTLDQRPNLMDLSPTEFEALITNLFEKMGLESKLTQASRDGGVDCVAFDPRPIFGGKVVIQAKRYKNTVGVSAVRDLFGTMQNEGASKGILVTTSGFGKASFEFANNKPIELLSGSNLLFLLKEHAGMEAKIVFPDNWKDTQPDN